MKIFTKTVLLICFFLSTNRSALASEQLQVGFTKETLARAVSYITINRLKTEDDLWGTISFAAAALGIQITADFIIALMHELGHAIPAKLLTQKNVEIVMGSYKKDDKTIVTIPGKGILPTVSIKGFSAYGGTLIAKHNNKIHEAIICASGPIAGFATGLTLIEGYNYINSDHILSPLLHKVLTMGTACFASFSLANLIPFGSHSDGYKIAENALALPEKKLKVVNAVGNWLMVPAIALGTYYLYTNS